MQRHDEAEEAAELLGNGHKRQFGRRQRVLGVRGGLADVCVYQVQAV